MNVLIVGSSAAGSWAMRGRQLGAAIGARATLDPSADDFVWADLVVLVKRAGPRWASIAHAAGVPVVWDALDFWAQPGENRFLEQGSRILLQQLVAVVRPVLVIGATEAMAAAATCGGYQAATCLPHHGRLEREPAPPRERCQVVAYDGAAPYLGRWESALVRSCRRRGWQFLPRCEDLREADVVVALRDGAWDGWMCREWKSGVKLANAILAGRPVITQEGAAWRELGPPGTVVATEHELEEALDHWAESGPRQAAYQATLTRWRQFALPALAAEFAGILAGAHEKAITV